MELNQFLFPAPIPSYSSSAFIGEIIYVPKYARDPNTNEVQQFVDPTTQKNASRVIDRSVSASPALSQQMPAEGDQRRRAHSPAELKGNNVGGAEAPPFTKEELALMSIRDEAVKTPAAQAKASEENKSKDQNQFQ